MTTAIAPARPTRAARPRTAAADASLAAAGVVVIVGVVLLRPRLPANGALVDLPIAAVLVWALWSRPIGGDTPPSRALRELAPGLWLIAFATTLSLYSSGLQSWALLSIVQSIYAVALFLAIYRVLWCTRNHLDAYARAVGGAVVVVVASLVLSLEPGARPAGTFYHPNYAGHFLAMVAIATPYAHGPLWVRRGTVLLACVGVVLTASFGALLMLASAAGFVLLRRLSMLWGAALLAVSAVVALVIPPDSLITQQGAVTETLSVQRFERSATGRFELWRTAGAAAVRAPQGVGPDGLRQLDLVGSGEIEAHNLYLSYLAERGALGLFGLVLLGALAWRHAPRAGAARPLLAAIFVANLFRETAHYRHMWVLLALALAGDYARLERDG